MKFLIIIPILAVLWILYVLTSGIAVAKDRIKKTTDTQKYIYYKRRMNLGVIILTCSMLSPIILYLWLLS